MSYEKKSIKQIVADIDQKKIYLPALQRKFVWGKSQIELLFDSLMRGYPFGSFLFWRLSRAKAESYVFYEFLTEYDERDPFNRRKTGAYLHSEITGVLDGQQRLSSMYIGLMGTHTERTPYQRRANPKAFEKTSLYLNLLSLPYVIDSLDKIATVEDQNFEFRFKTDQAAVTSVSRKIAKEPGAEVTEEATFWMKVGLVLSWDEEPEFDEIFKGFLAQCATSEQKVAITQQSRLIKRGLDILHKRIQKDALINYFEVAKDDLEDILKIFVRVNSGGTVLSKTDLLFSTIVATWDDGREQIENLLKIINKKGDQFNFSSEYLMRCCLVLSDGPVIYKVKSFKSENVQRIRDEWPKIAEAVRKTVDLLVEFGFSGSLLPSQNATIIIAYYLYKGGDQTAASKDGIRKYLIHALLNGIYGIGGQEALINSLRGFFREEVATQGGLIAFKGRHKSFSFEELRKLPLPRRKSLEVTEADIEKFLQSTKGPSSFLVLSLLYPQLRYNEVMFHQDHIHPAAGFSDANLQETGIPKEQWPEWRARRDSVPNLQLLEGRQNISKNATPFKRWVERWSDADWSDFSGKHHFPDQAKLGFDDFMEFFTQRKEVLRGKLGKVLALNNEKPIEELTELRDQDEEVGLQDNQPDGEVAA